jgi:hypothetical protein
MVVLAEFAGKVASRGRNGICQGPGQNMEERFFFDRVNLFGRHPAIDERIEFPSPVFTGAAEPPLAIGYRTPTGTNPATDCFILQPLVKKGFLRSRGIFGEGIGFPISES